MGSFGLRSKTGAELDDRHEEPLKIMHKRQAQGHLELELLTVRTPKGERLICQVGFTSTFEKRFPFVKQSSD